MEEAIKKCNILNQVLENLTFTSKVYSYDEILFYTVKRGRQEYKDYKRVHLLFKTDTYNINNFIGIVWQDYPYFIISAGIPKLKYDLYAEYILGGECKYINKEFIDKMFVNNDKTIEAKKLNRYGSDIVELQKNLSDKPNSFYNADNIIKIDSDNIDLHESLLEAMIGEMTFYKKTQ